MENLDPRSSYAAAIEPTLGYQIGTYAASSGQAFEGGINLVRMYRDNLYDMEVRSLYDQQINRTSTNGTRTVNHLNLNITSAVPAMNQIGVTGQLYPRFTKWRLDGVIPV